MALRPRGIIGLVATLAATTGLIAVYLPWYGVRFDVRVLGAREVGTIASLAGWQAQPWIWLGAALSVIAAVIGLAVAIDRRPPRAGLALATIALAQATTTGLSALFAPPPSRLLADEQLRRLRNLPAAVPDDVGVTFAVDVGAGIWVGLAAAALLLAAALAMRET